MSRPTVEYVVGADLDNLGIFYRVNKELVDFSTGYSFSLKVDDLKGVNQFTTTSGFAGAVGSGTKANGGTPNVTKVWDTTGELNSLSAGQYLAQLTIVRDADSRQRIRQFYLRMVDAA